MKRLGVMLALLTAIAGAQTNSVGPQVEAYINVGGLWTGATTPFNSFAIDAAPAVELYCLNTSTSKWVPWTSACAGGSSSFTLTTTGTSGAATYSGGVLNIPQYTGGAAFPGTNGLVYNTSATTSATATSSQIQSGIGTGVYASYGCPLNNATQFCITQVPYNASTSGATTTASSATFAAGTTGTVASCSTFVAGNGVYIAGAGASGANYIGTIVSCAGTALTVTPATSTSVASGALVKHDETAAFQAAITAIGSSGGTIYIPDGTYLVNGSLQDTGGANAVLTMPAVALNSAPSQSITLKGLTRPVGIGDTGGAIIQTDINSGNFLGGYSAAGPFGGFIAANVSLENVRFRSTSTNPCAVMVNGTFFATLSTNDIWIDSKAAGTPTCTTGAGVYYSTLSNDVENNIPSLSVVGFYALARFSEHAHVGRVDGANSHLGYVFDSESGSAPGSTAGNTISVDYMWCQLCDYEISAGVSQTTVNIQAADFEVTTTAAVNDPGNLLRGQVNYNVPYNDARSTSTITAAMVNGGTNLYMNNLKYPGAFYSTANRAWSITDTPNPDTYGTYLELKNSTSSSDWTMQVFGSTFVNAGDTGFGFYDVPTGRIPFRLNDTLLNLSNVVTLGFASGDAGTTQPDTGFSRTAPGTVWLGNGTNGDKTGLFGAAEFTGPATAPSGACSVIGWAFSQDGHATFCNGTSWATKI